mmetsp:Transcript_11710/g.27288  ORF Transcript_11710/g.27288 Transcript_11710/m.27288 type:complete len:90 (+) Transcript_11710:197-466(+)
MARLMTNRRPSSSTTSGTLQGSERIHHRLHRLDRLAEPPDLERHAREHFFARQAWAVEGRADPTGPVVEIIVDPKRSMTSSSYGQKVGL